MKRTITPTREPVAENSYEQFLVAVQQRFALLTMDRVLFTVAVEGPSLWEIYLAAIPEAERQTHTCHSCKRFLEQYGHLAVLDENGAAVSPFWDDLIATPALSKAVQQLARRVEASKVNGVFLSGQEIWGTPKTGEWHHLAVRPAAHLVHRGALLTAAQRAAELQEDFRCLNVALDEFGLGVLTQARVILEADALARSEKFLGPVTWLMARHMDRKARNPKVRTNRLWQAVATAPPGFCKPRAGMVGSLLEDVAAGLSVEEVKRRFDAKMHPLQYQRPQAAPTLGAIRQAEQAFETLGLAPALERRFATLADVQVWIWQPAAEAAAGTDDSPGVFDHLKPKDPLAGPLVLPRSKTLTWVKFRDTVLPQAEVIDLMVPLRSALFCAFVTAVGPAAPPLLRWDQLERRNPVNWYYYHGPRSAQDWSLLPGPVRVVGIAAKPPHWHETVEHEGEAVMFVLAGARDQQNSSLALFPETLRSELHGVRSVLEAYSQSRSLQPVEGPLASGMMLGQGSRWENVQVRVTTKESVATYQLDRWD
jgi:hypothetical protein